MVSFLLFNEMACSSPVILCVQEKKMLIFIHLFYVVLSLYVTDHCVDSYFAPVLGLYCSLSGYYNMNKKVNVHSTKLSTKENFHQR